MTFDNWEGYCTTCTHFLDWHHKLPAAETTYRCQECGCTITRASLEIAGSVQLTESHRMREHFTSPDLLEALSLDVGPLTLARWVRSHSWAVTTEDDCWGHPPGSTEPERYALYDADADEPPVAVFSSSEDAQRVAAVLNAYGEL